MVPRSSPPILDIVAPRTSPEVSRTVPIARVQDLPPSRWVGELASPLSSNLRAIVLVLAGVIVFAIAVVVSGSVADHVHASATGAAIALAETAVRADVDP